MVCTKPYEWCDVCNPETSGGSLLADWVKTFLSLHYFGLYCSQYLRIDLHYAAKNILALLLSDFLLCTLICLNLKQSQSDGLWLATKGARKNVTPNI